MNVNVSNAGQKQKYGGFHEKGPAKRQ